MSALPDDFWNTLPLHEGITLLTRDANGLAAFDKVAGVLSHPNGSEDEARALLTCRYDKEAQCFIWKSTDGGLNWRNLNPGNFDVDRSATDVLVDPRKPQRVFAAIFDLDVSAEARHATPPVFNSYRHRSVMSALSTILLSVESVKVEYVKRRVE